MLGRHQKDRLLAGAILIFGCFGGNWLAGQCCSVGNQSQWCVVVGEWGVGGWERGERGANYSTGRSNLSGIWGVGAWSAREQPDKTPRSKVSRSPVPDGLADYNHAQMLRPRDTHLELRLRRA